MTTASINILGADGKIARKLPSYELRPPQLEMAEAVTAAFNACEHLIVEAGTGVGKSFAYLVPAIQHVTHDGGRVVISTNTIALQEQLIQKDIPFLQSVFSDSFSAVLVKGRANYLGLRRLARASGRQDVLFDAGTEITELHRIEDWAYGTEDGSLSDLPRQPAARVWDRVRSDGDDCLGRKCSQFGKCFYQRARRQAGEAQLLIVNHALLFSDLALRASGASILPDYDFLVLDEAHTVEGVAGDHLGIGITNTQVRFLLNMIFNERSGRGVLDRDQGRKMLPLLKKTHHSLDTYFADLLNLCCPDESWNGRVREAPPIDQRITSDLLELDERLREQAKEKDDADDKLELTGLSDRCKSLALSIDQWARQKVENAVYWMEVGGARRQRITLAARPLSVGAILKEHLFDKLKSVILTSATLATHPKDPFAYIQHGVGLSDGRTECLGSPFNYQQQLTIHIVQNMPDPTDAEAFIEASSKAIRKYVLMTEGRAFVLFTSYGMLNRCAESLRGFFDENDFALWIHGSDLPRSMLLEKFRTTPRSVLFGTDTFWAGVDVPGEALSNVIIVKLPFAVPNHPVVEARIETMRTEGRNPFMEYQLPEAVLKFKQGVGRLIRTKKDKGIAVILDPRVHTKRYGKRFLDALPKCKVVVE